MLTMKVNAGDEITDCIANAIKHAVQNDTPVQFVHNGVTVTVDIDSDRTLIYRDWQRARHGAMGKDAKVGPRAKEKLNKHEADTLRVLESRHRVKMEGNRLAWKEQHGKMTVTSH